MRRAPARAIKRTCQVTRQGLIPIRLRSLQQHLGDNNLRVAGNY